MNKTGKYSFYLYGDGTHTGTAPIIATAPQRFVSSRTPQRFVSSRTWLANQKEVVN